MRTRVTRTLALWAMCVGLGIFSLIVADAAFGKNNPHPTLDAVASYIAGEPLTAYCETDQTAWDEELYKWGYFGSQVRGYTKIWGERVVYLSPRVCLSLHLALDYGWEDAKHVGTAIHTLIHEAVHQQGEGNYDEHLTDCISLNYTEEIAIKFFKMPPMKKYTYTYLKYVNAKLVPTKMTKVEPNKYLRDVVQWAVISHNTAGPPYSGAC